MKSFIKAWGQSPGIPYYALLIMFISRSFLEKIQWSNKTVLFYGQQYLKFLICWGILLYICFFAILHFKRLWLLLPAGFLTNVLMQSAAGLNTEMFIFLFTLFAVSASLGKRYEVILRCFLFVALFTLLIAGTGRIFGFTEEVVKPDNISPGHSFGTAHPNNWGYTSFLVLILIWYLYLKDRTKQTFFLFWGSTLFIYFVVSCRTIALFTAVFPFLGLAVEAAESGKKIFLMAGEDLKGERISIDVGKTGMSPERVKEKPSITLLEIMASAMPVICFLLTVLLGFHMEWLHRYLYATPLKNMATRFVDSGLLLRHFGIPAFGIGWFPFDDVTAIFGGKTVILRAADNAYSFFAIFRGGLWLLFCLLVLCLAGYRCILRRNCRLLLLSVLMAVFALMERPGLELWYNFMFLYPLSGVKKNESVCDCTRSERGQVFGQLS